MLDIESDDSGPGRTRRQMALSRWENEGGATNRQPDLARESAPGIPPRPGSAMHPLTVPADNLPNPQDVT